MKGDLERVPKKANKQKKVIIYKKVCSTQYVYASINCDALQNAMSVLSHGRGLEVWLYLAKNQPGYEPDLSSKDACDRYGISNDRFQKGVKELIDKGFLNYIETPYGNTWEFIEFPNSDLPWKDKTPTTEQTPSSKIQEGSDTKKSQEDPSIKIQEGASIKIQEGVPAKSRKGSIEIQEQILHNNTIDNTIDNTKGRTSPIVGDALPGLTPPQVEAVLNQKEEVVEVKDKEEPAVCHIESTTEQAEEQPEPDLTAIPFPIDKCIEKTQDQMKNLIKQYGSPERYECGEYTYFAFACVPEFSSAKYAKVKKVKP